MGTAHMKMLLEDLEMQELKDPVPIIIDSKSANLHMIWGTASGQLCIHATAYVDTAM